MGTKQSREADQWISAKQVKQMTGLSLTTIYEGRCETDKLKRIILRTHPAQKRATIRFSLQSVMAWLHVREQASTLEESQSKKRRISASDRVIELARYKREKAG